MISSFKSYGFIYIWKKQGENRFYLGSHWGSEDDGYIGSGIYFKNAYNKDPELFRRKVIESGIKDKRETIKRENYWLNMIRHSELSEKYYNLKNVAAGGDIYSGLSKNKKEEIREQSRLGSNKYWSNISEEDYDHRCKTAFGGNNFDRSYMIYRNKDLCSKSAIIQKDGKEIIVHNITEFCELHNINRGNFSTMLRGERKSCNGWSGAYV